MSPGVFFTTHPPQVKVSEYSSFHFPKKIKTYSELIALRGRVSELRLLFPRNTDVSDFGLDLLQFLVVYKVTDPSSAYTALNMAFTSSPPGLSPPPQSSDPSSHKVDLSPSPVHSTSLWIWEAHLGRTDQEENSMGIAECIERPSSRPPYALSGAAHGQVESEEKALDRVFCSPPALPGLHPHSEQSYVPGQVQTFESTSHTNRGSENNTLMFRAQRTEHPVTEQKPASANRLEKELGIIIQEMQTARVHLASIAGSLLALSSAFLPAPVDGTGP
ncbi:hypothetical protein KIL84_009298 [Mauremys mutica]|uniref:Uncharacterized protein n=1 Tax=Mauremys mutica TaxID=74926 RepID=A0A9D4AXU0_9SAUR|nr:hypothetical protein KIL84_009298 [Mauremys mutica]